MPQLFSNVSSKLAQIPKKILYTIALILITIVVAILTVVLLSHINSPPPSTIPDTPTSPTPSDSPDTPTEPVPEFIDLQSTINTWLKTVEADVGLVVYDLDNRRIAAAYQPDKVFNTASIYKLFYAYVGYRQIQTGALSGDDILVTTKDYRHGTYTLSECLDLIIRESYNGCADHLRNDEQFNSRVKAFINELDLKNTTNLGLSSSANDLTKLLIYYYEHFDLNDELWNKISDSMLRQPPTAIEEGEIYDWRQGLPAGFSDKAKVYNKVGWEWNGESWNTYADAAIIEFPDLNRHYTIVALTSGIKTRTPRPLIQLGQAIETAVISASS